MNKSFLPQYWKKLRSLLGDLPNIFTLRRNLTPVPNVCRILRLSNVPKDYQEKGRILPIQLGEKAFEMSSLDKETPPPHLSVWDESLTTAKQAYNFLRENSLCKLVIRLNVDEVRKIEVVAEDKNKYSGLLDVIWVQLLHDSNGKKIKDRRPGAKGHCGITGLDENSTPGGLTKKQAKIFRKSLRFQLAELASKDHSLLDD